MASLLINDGYTLTATISQKPWPDLKITYRPALPEKVYDWLQSRNGNGRDRMKSVVALLEGQLQSWDADEGKCPCIADNWRKLPHPVLERIVDLVTGYAVPEGEEKN